MSFWKAQVGYISPSVLELVPYYFYRIVPEDVGLVGVTCMIGGWAKTEFEKGLAAVDEAATELARRGVDFILHGGGPLVASRGPGFEKELESRITKITNIPCGTGIGSAIRAYQRLKISRASFVTPFPQEVNEQYIASLKRERIDIVSLISLKVDFKKISSVPLSTIEEAVRRAAKEKSAEAVHVPCPQWLILSITGSLEESVGKPILTSTGTMLWDALSRIGVTGVSPRYGQLLTQLNQPVEAAPSS